MGFFSKLVKAGIDTVSLPIAIIKDVATLGGAILGNERTFTGKKFSEINDDIEEAKREL